MRPPALLITGGNGQLGSELARLRSLRRDGLVHAPGSAELDITDAEAVTDAIDSFADAASDAGLRPVLINTAAYTAVDDAEQDRNRAELVNAKGPATLASVCRKRGFPMLQLSTDYVFAGEATTPYEADDATGPRSVYGKTKLAGERAVLDTHPRAWVVRTAWVYGARGSNFVKTMARLEAERDTVSVVRDQVGSPTWAGDLANGLLELAASVARRDEPRSKVLHWTNSGQASKWEFARAVFDELDADPDRVLPCTSEQFQRPAPRPAYSVLSARSWLDSGLTAPRDWREALTAAFERDGAALRPRQG